MFWLVENKEQFREFLGRSFDEAFVEIIPNNSWQHPSQNSICAFYIRHIEDTKGFILPVSHTETGSLFEDEIYLYLKRLKKIYVRDKKEFL